MYTSSTTQFFDANSHYDKCTDAFHEINDLRAVIGGGGVRVIAPATALKMGRHQCSVR
jgi:hypothetical protein